jgi:predicted nucleotidyltransferase
VVKKKYIVFATITSKTKGKKPILVGGSAVEFYTQGAYKSLDLDVIAIKKELEPTLKAMGFKKSGRHWYNEDVSLKIVSSQTKEKVKKVNIEKYTIHMISVEDLIVDRLNACKYWKSQLDCEQAEYLLKAYYPSLNKTYLEKRAREEGVSKRLNTLKNLI